MGSEASKSAASGDAENLHQATTAAQVEALIAKGEDIEKVVKGMHQSNRKTPLISACERGVVEVVDSLLSHGANPNHVPPHSWGPIQWAARKGHLDVVKRLIDAGVNVDDVQQGNTALHLASMNGHTNVVEHLISLGANRDSRDSDEKTPLMWASQEGHCDVVDRLLAAGCDVNAVDQHQYNALTWAVQEGHTAIAERLIANGIEVDVQNYEQETPLMIACSRGNIDAVRLLLDHGADPLIFNKDGNRAFNLVPVESAEIQTLLNGLILLSSFHHHQHHLSCLLCLIRRGLNPN